MTDARKYFRFSTVAGGIGLLAVLTYIALDRPQLTVGEVDAVDGHTVLATTETSDEWASTSAGELLSIGDILRTVGESTATIRLWSGGMLRVGFDSIVRFLPQGPDANGEVELVTGQVVIEAVVGDLNFGAILVEEGARVAVTVSAEVVELRVLRGYASIRAARGTQRLSLDQETTVPRRVWEAGHRLSQEQNGVGGSVDRLNAGADRESAEETNVGDDVAPDVVPDTPSLIYVGPSDLAVRAGDSPMVHEHRGRARAKIEFGHLCTNGGFVTTGPPEGDRYGDPDGDSGTIALQRGQNPYVVYCPAGPDGAPNRVAAGTLRLSADSGFSPRPRRAQRNRVNADGRRYSVVYQNLRPTLTFRWPSAPTATSYTLIITDLTGRTRRVRRRRANITLRGTQLQAGMYSWHFEGGGERSPTTWTRLTFEQPPRRFAFTSPGPGRVSPGAVRVSGLAPSGTRVSVGGREFVTNGAGEFAGTARVAPSTGTLAIRVRHPSLGSHIYLRRIRGGSL